MGLTKQGLRDKLALDLKITIDTEMSVAELDRSIERAVDDLSRSLPLERVHEETLDFTVTDESITTPATASATALVNGHSLVGETDGATMTIATLTTDVPRRLTVTLTDANKSISSLTVIVKGYDQDGNYIEESWYLKDILVSGTAYQGNLYFKRITQVELDNVVGNAAGDTLSVGTGNAYDSYIFLANKPIRPESEEVTNAAGTTTYTRDTDYTMDYSNGAIKFITGGSMAAGTAYLVDYTKSRLGIDISSILPVVTRIQRVQYPMTTIPQQFVSYSIIGDFMYVGSRGTGRSQEELTDKKHIAIYYERKQMPPGEDSPGSYPDYLDEVVAIGAGGYALLIEALQYEQQAVTDLASLRTELGLTTALHTLVVAALNKVTDYVNEAHTQTGTATTFLNNNTNEDSVFWLTKITTDIAGLRTAILAAVDDANTYLDDVDSTDLGKATVGAEALLETGDDRINVLNTGSRVAENYSEYSKARVTIAQARTTAALGFIQEATVRIDNLRTYIQQAEGWSNIAQGFFTDTKLRIDMAQAHISEANQYIMEMDRYLSEAAQYKTTAETDLMLADRFRAEGTARLTDFNSILKNKAEYRRRVSSVPVKQPA